MTYRRSPGPSLGRLAPALTLSGWYPMPARPYPGMGVARRLGSARGTWTYAANVYVIE